MDAVALEQQRVRLGIGQVVDRDQFQPAVGAFEDGARHEATDASETVDCDFHCHVGESFLRMGGRCLIVQPFQDLGRSEEHTSELQSLMRISYAVFCLKKKKK